MGVVKRIGAAAIAAAVAVVLMTPMSAEARNGRVAAGIVGGLAAGALFGAAIGGGYWGPYPYYGYPGPVDYYPPAPYWGPYGYGGCGVRAVWAQAACALRAGLLLNPPALAFDFSPAGASSW